MAGVADKGRGARFKPAPTSVLDSCRKRQDRCSQARAWERDEIVLALLNNCLPPSRPLRCSGVKQAARLWRGGRFSAMIDTLHDTIHFRPQRSTLQ